MYVRFVIDELDEDSNQRTGIFQAIYNLRKVDEFYDYELEQISEILQWFDDNLESPLDFLNKQRSKKSDVCISWFLESAYEHILKIREFIVLIESKGIVVEQITTDNPGKIIYSDSHQVFAKPFKRF